MSATTIAACASASVIPASRTSCIRYVLNDFAKSERPWVDALCDVIADNAEMLAKGQDASFQNKIHLALAAKGFLDKEPKEPRPKRKRQRKSARELNGFQMRHRRPAQCRQVDALQRADRDRGGAGGELSVLHDRAERRRGRGARPAPRPAGRAREVGRRSCRRASTFVDIAGLVRGASKGEGLGNQFLANIREVDAIAHVVRCFEDDDVTHVEGRIDPVARHRDGRDRADARRPRQPGAARRRAGEKRARAATRKRKEPLRSRQTVRWSCCARASRRDCVRAATRGGAAVSRRSAC